MKNTLNVTIGIPAHNEAANIGNLLESIKAQTGNNFILEELIVFCDGCTDNTASIARSFGAHVIAKEKREGKMSALNQIYSLNNSDILITLDADLVLADMHEIAKITEIFTDPNVSIAAFHQEPVESNTFVGKICRAADQCWIESRIYINNGDHIHNLQGSATAIRGRIARKIRYPCDLNNDAGYLYLQAKKYGTFQYAFNTKVLYRSPDTLGDFWLIGSRAIFYRYEKLAKYLGRGAINEYEIPLRFKIRGLSITFLRSPVYTSFAIILNMLVRVFPKKGRGVKSRKWEMAQSARKAILI